MDLEKEVTKLEKFLVKQGREELVFELRNLNNEEKKQRLLKQAVYEQEILDAKGKDEELKKAKESVKALGSSYSENLRMNKKISRFIHLLMETGS